MQRVFIIFFLYFFVYNLGFAQVGSQKKIDSFLRVLPILKDDTNKLIILNNLSNYYKNVNPEEGIKYGLQCLDIAKRLKITKFICEANNSIGNNYEAKADYPKALEYFLSSLKILEEQDIKNESVANILSNIGTVYLNQTNYEKALEYYQKAIPIYEKSGKKLGLANTLNGIGTVYGIQKNYSQSLDYYTKALSINETIGNTDGIAQIFGNLGDNYKDQNNYPKALDYYNKALNIYELNEDKDGIATNLGNMGKCYLAIAKAPSNTITADSLIAGNKISNLKKSIQNLDKGILMSREVGDIANIIDFSLALSESYALTDNLVGAYDNLKLYTTLHDSVFSAQNNQKIVGLETQRERELKTKIDRLQKIQHRNETLAVIAGFMVLLIIIFIVLKNYSVQKKSNKLLAIEKQKSDDLLLNILPVEVAEELKEHGSAAAKYFDNVTVLFTDFVGFTTVASQMSPQELVAELHTCFKAFDEIIAKYKIEKIKTIGDAYMAISGLPAANNNHALDIVNAAIDIKRYIYERTQVQGNKSFNIRIGIHTGNVVAGIVGVRKFAYDIWGDTVNTAARMEQNSQPGKINISDATYVLIKHKIECTYRGEIEAKHKGMLKMYFVVA